MKALLLCLFLTVLTALVASSQAVFRISSGAQLLVNNGTSIVLDNTGFENNGNAGLGSTSRFVFTGNSPSVSIDGTFTTLFGELELNKSAGVVQLNRQTSILGSVIFTSGNLDLNGNTLFLVSDPNGQLVGENTNSRVLGNSGLVRKNTVLNAPVNANPGNMGVFITSSQNLGATLIERQHNTVNNQNVRRVFHISPANNAALNATVRFQYLDVELGGLDESLLSVWKSPNGTANWTNQGGLVDIGQNSITLNNVNDFAWFTIAPSNAALPVILNSFTVTCTNEEVLLKWQTAQEQNTAYFEIQSSLNGSSWSAVGRVAARGNSNTAIDYQYKDLPAGRKYYRLRMVDNDEKFTYSPVQTVSCANNSWNITAYPNPASDRIELTINGINRHSLPVKIVNASGQLVWQQEVALNNQYRKLSIPLAPLAAGIYFIKIDDVQYNRTITISKQ
jgi:hypothetical protein